MRQTDLRHTDMAEGVGIDDLVGRSTAAEVDPAAIFADPVTYLAAFGLSCVLVETRSLATAA